MKTSSLFKQLRLQQSLELFIGVLATLALANLVEGVTNGKSVGLGDCFREAAHRWPASIWTQLLLRFCLVLGAIALVVPAVFLGVATFYSLLFVALRGLTGTAAFKASWGLVKGRWWPSCRLLTLLLLCQIGLTVPIGGLTAVLPEEPAISVAVSLLTDLVGAYFTVADVVLFLHLERSAWQPTSSPPPLPVLEPA